MSWAKLDDAILDNPKIVRAGLVGFALHVAAITWCARNLTDGFIPESKASRLLETTWSESDDERDRCIIWDLNSGSGMRGRGPTETIAGVIDLLVEIGLWESAWDELGNPGFRIHDYCDFNPTRAQVLEERERQRSAKSSAGAAGGRRSAETRRARFGSAQPKQAPKQNRSSPGADSEAAPEADIEARASEVLPKQPRSRSCTRNEAEAAGSTAKPVLAESDSCEPSHSPKQPRSPVPVPVPEETTTTAGAAKVPCPAGLKLSPAQIEVLSGPGSEVPGWAIESIATDWLASNVGRSDAPRTLDQWRTTLAKVVSSTWRDRSRRPKRPEPDAPDHQTSSAWVSIGD